MEELRRRLDWRLDSSFENVDIQGPGTPQGGGLYGGARIYTDIVSPRRRLAS